MGINYHFATSKKIDPYVGIASGVGYFINFGEGGFSDEGTLSGTMPLFYGFKLGMNVLNKKQNAWSFELGYDYLSYLKIGYTFIKKK